MRKIICLLLGLPLLALVQTRTVGAKTEGGWQIVNTSVTRGAHPCSRTWREGWEVHVHSIVHSVVHSPSALSFLVVTSPRQGRTHPISLRSSPVR
jgi:hypothetical protein